MAVDQILTSIHGRRLGLTASGGLAFQPTTSTGLSRAMEMSSAGVVNSSISSFNSTISELEVDALKSVVETISSSAGTMSNSGLSVISSDVINGSVLTLSAPETGVHKEIFGISSASTITLNTTAATINFQTSFGASSSAYTFDNTGGVTGTSLRLAGLSGTRWAVLNRTTV